MSTYNIGDLATLTATFQDGTGTAVDPTTVTFTIYPPDGTSIVPTPNKTAAGNYTANQQITQAGQWVWHVLGIGAVQAAAYGSFICLPPQR